MKPVDVHSEEFQRGMALHYLKEHKREKQFWSGLAQPTIDELKTRGCEVVLEREHGIYTVSSPVPFGRLVSPAEWKQDRFELLHGCGLFLMWKLGFVAVIGLAVSLHMGQLTSAIWCFGWLCIYSVASPETERRDKLVWLAAGLSLFGAGIAVNLLGWSQAK
jgi:hypothetical protein